MDKIWLCESRAETRIQSRSLFIFTSKQFHQTAHGSEVTLSAVAQHSIDTAQTSKKRSLRYHLRPHTALPPTTHLSLHPMTGYKLTNEQQTNQQTWQIAIPPRGGYKNGTKQNNLA